MATTITEYTSNGWQQIAGAAGEYLVEISTDYFYAWGSASPAANQVGYAGKGRVALPFVVVSGSALWVRPRSTGALGPWKAIVTGASQ